MLTVMHVIFPFDADSYTCFLVDSRLGLVFCLLCFVVHQVRAAISGYLVWVVVFVLCCDLRCFFWNVLCYAYALNAWHMPGSIHISSHFGSIQHYSAWRSLCWSHANIVAYPLSIWNTVHVEFHIVMSIANYKIGHCINMLVGRMPSGRLS